MPELTEYPLDPLRPEDLEGSDTSELRKRTQEIDAAWDYYNGNHRRPLKVRTGQPDDNVIINMAQRVIDQSASMLFGEVPTFEIDDAEESPREQRLGEVWAANRASILLHSIAVSGALAGHVFVKLLPDEKRGVRYILLNPRIVSVYWHPQDMERVTAYKVEWTDGQTDYRQDLINLDTRWRILDMRRDRGRKWQIVEDAIWSFPWAPILDWENLPSVEGYYGLHDLQNVTLNDSLNFIASNTARIIKHHAHPKTIGTGMRAADVQESSVDSFWTIPSSDAQIFNLEMQSELASSMAFMEFLQASFYSQHRAVDVTSVKDRLGQLTNFGLKVLYRDALDKLATKRELYGEALAEMNRRTLLILGMGDSEPVVQWPDPMPYNDLEEIQAVQQELELGLISKRTASSIRGRDWTMEQERMAEEGTGDDSIGARLLQAFERGQ